MEKTLHLKLFKIQNAITNPKKTTKGYNYQYSPLDEVLDLIKPLLSEYYLQLSQIPIYTQDMTGIKTIIYDLDSNQTFEADLLMESKGKTPQQVGSILTYTRRYLLLSMFNLAPVGEEDDGECTNDQPRFTKKRF